MKKLYPFIALTVLVSGCAYVEYQPQPTPEPKPTRYDTQYTPAVMFAKIEDK